MNAEETIPQNPEILTAEKSAGLALLNFVSSTPEILKSLTIVQNFRSVMIQNSSNFKSLRIA